MREIRDILQLSTEEQLGKIIKALSLQTGTSVIYNELLQLTSLNYEGVIKHLNILEKTFVIKRVLPFYTNKRLEIAKTPKIYFLDNGLKNTVISNFDSLEDRVDRGSLNKNFVASELVKNEHNLNYWRTKSNAEVDFIIEENRRNIAIEVKSTLNTRKVERGLLNFKEKYNPDKIIIASETYFSFEAKRDLLFIPIFFI